MNGGKIVALKDRATNQLMETTAGSLTNWSREDIAAKLAISKPSLTVSNYSSIGIYSLVNITHGIYITIQVLTSGGLDLW